MSNTLKNPKATPLVRGFLLGMLYEKGHTLTTARIRREMKVSKATAKRDMTKIAGLVPVVLARSAGQRGKLARRPKP